MEETTGGIMEAVHFAVGLGGWKVDPSDPWKEPYAPEEAALWAVQRYGIDDPEHRETIERIVRIRYEDDPRNPEDYR